MIQDGIRKTEGRVTSFLMVGQSNMAGRGDLSAAEPIRNPLCYMLRMGRWQRMHEPINPDRAISGIECPSGISLAASFADAFALEQGRAVGLIPCADGGTRIAEWMPGEVLFDHAVMMTALAKRSSSLGGILWHQGESDCMGDGFAPDAYKEKLICMLTALRTQVGDETLPIVIGEISEQITERWKVGKNPAEMNRLLHTVAKELPRCAIASAKGLTLRKDGIHFDAASCRSLGRRYYEAYKTLCE